MSQCRFQTFDETSDPGQGPTRLAQLREALRARGLDGFVVPHNDAYQNEYVPASEERLAWLTGFTGSAGKVIILSDRAALFVDGRYSVQARAQVDVEVFEIIDITETPPSAWLREALRPSQRLGYDPWLQTPNDVEILEKACAEVEAVLAPVVENPIDMLWRDRPAEPSAPAILHPLAFAGEAAEAKLGRTRNAVREAGADTLLMTDPHAVAWLFNLRGADVMHTPLPLARAIVPVDDRPTLFIAGAKLSAEVRAELEPVTDLAEPDGIGAALTLLGDRAARVLLDPSQAPAALASRLTGTGALVVAEADPVARLKAVKNAAEIEGARAAQKRDAIALCRFLAWLDRRAPTDGLTEIDAVAALETFRRETGLLKDISFPTISAAGPNAALPHYRVTTSSNRVITSGFFLVDSGGQYQDGTTDVTRTVVVGDVSAEMRDRFTRVLKGHIAIATARFPKGTTGAHLDTLARRPLWDIGTDFDHGTGHGVGSYLSVHEGPHRISKLARTALEPGLILSNEPGYYREGHYGIRTENLILVREAEIPGAERPMLDFETLTLAPIDRRAIALDLLTREEWTWINDYHARVLKEVGPELDIEARNWLTAACAPL